MPILKMTRSLRIVGLTALLLAVGSAAVAQDRDMDTRAEVLAAMRAQKAQAVEPYKPKGIEKALLYIENNRILDRFTVGDGWYPLIGRLTTGAGLAGGAGYRKHLFNEQLLLNSAFVMSMRAYKLAVVDASYPRLWNDRLEVGTNFRWQDFPQEDFYGIGSNSTIDTRTNYALESTDISGRVVFKPITWLRIGTDIGLFDPSIGRGTDTRMPSIEQVFTDAGAPGLDDQPSFFYKTLSVEFDYRDQPGNARSGGLWRASYGAWDDRDLHVFDFGRFDAEVAHFFPIFDKKRVFAVRGGVSYVNNDPESRVPFYVLPYVGGANTIRSFREFRFRDENAVFFNVEYRWEAFAGLDMALFVDAGKVAADWEDVNLSDLKTGYGIGFRFNTYKSVFLRFDVGTGGGEGTRLFFKFGPAF